MNGIMGSIVEQVRMACQRKNRLAMVCGFILGSFIPVASYFVAHHDVQIHRAYWILVVGGLMFSAMTVYDWTCIAFQSRFKAFGFCLLVEGVMTFSTMLYLSYAALAVLAIINGIGTGCKIALNQRQCKKEQREIQRAAQIGTKRPRPVTVPQKVAV